MKQQTIYVPVSVKERFPSDSIECFVINDTGEMMKLDFDNPSKEFYDSEGYSIPITHWLEKKIDLITCTKEDLIAVGDAGKTEEIDGYRDRRHIRTVKEYLESEGIKL